MNTNLKSNELINSNMPINSLLPENYDCFQLPKLQMPLVGNSASMSSTDVVTNFFQFLHQQQQQNQQIQLMMTTPNYSIIPQIKPDPNIFFLTAAAVANKTINASNNLIYDVNSQQFTKELNKTMPTQTQMPFINLDFNINNNLFVPYTENNSLNDYQVKQEETQQQLINNNKNNQDLSENKLLNYLNEWQKNMNQQLQHCNQLDQNNFQQPLQQQQQKNFLINQNSMLFKDNEIKNCLINSCNITQQIFKQLQLQQQQLQYQQQQNFQQPLQQNFEYLQKLQNFTSINHLAVNNHSNIYSINSSMNDKTKNEVINLKNNENQQSSQLKSQINMKQSTVSKKKKIAANECFDSFKLLTEEQQNKQKVLEITENNSITSLSTETNKELINTKKKNNSILNINNSLINMLNNDAPLQTATQLQQPLQLESLSPTSAFHLYNSSLSAKINLNDYAIPSSSLTSLQSSTNSSISNSNIFKASPSSLKLYDNTYEKNINNKEFSTEFNDIYSYLSDIKLNLQNYSKELNCASLLDKQQQQNANNLSEQTTIKQATLNNLNKKIINLILQQKQQNIYQQQLEQKNFQKKKKEKKKKKNEEIGKINVESLIISLPQTTTASPINLTQSQTNSLNTTYSNNTNNKNKNLFNWKSYGSYYDSDKTVDKQNFITQQDNKKNDLEIIKVINATTKTKVSCNTNDSDKNKNLLLKPKKKKKFSANTIKEKNIKKFKVANQLLQYTSKNHNNSSNTSVSSLQLTNLQQKNFKMFQTVNKHLLTLTSNQKNYKMQDSDAINQKLDNMFIDNKLKDKNSENEEDPVDVTGDETYKSTVRLQKKKYIDFRRKISAICTRSFKTNLKIQCSICNESILINNKNVCAHIYSHSVSPLFVCKICQRGFMESHLILKHLHESHPSKIENSRKFYEDRREMNILLKTLHDCFPRVRSFCTNMRSEFIE